MRVIAGTARGRRLRAPRGAAIRPTTDRVKEALFAILGPRVPGARVLDLFAGTGQLGIEALSRGAGRAVFVDPSGEAVRTIRENLARTELAEAGRVLRTGAEAALERLAREGASFDLILLDPPYGTGLAGAVLEALGEKAEPLLGPDGLVVVEHGEKEEIPNSAENLCRVRQSRYGDTILSFYRAVAGCVPGEGGNAP